MFDDVRIKSVQYGHGGGNARYTGRPTSNRPPDRGRVVLRSDGADVCLHYQGAHGECVLRFSAELWEEVGAAGSNAVFGALT